MQLFAVVSVVFFGGSSKNICNIGSQQRSFADMKTTTNIIDAAGYLAISTRLQRLADSLRKDGSRIYEHFGIEFEPKFWPVLYTLSKKSPMGIIDLANEIGYAHPSVIALVREMEQKKWIRSVKDKTDSRRRLLSLSPLALELVAQMEPVWAVIKSALEEICEGESSLLSAIEAVEARVALESFSETARRIARARSEQRPERFYARTNQKHSRFLQPAGSSNEIFDGRRRGGDD